MRLFRLSVECSFVLVFVCISMLLVSTANAGQAKKLSINTGHKEPYVKILSGILKEACGRIGYDVEVNAFPSQRALVLSNEQGDGEAARVKSIKKLAPSNTDNLLLVSESSITLVLMVFTKGLKFEVSGWDSLEPYRNGARIGAKILEKNVPGRQTFLANNKQLFKMLNAGRLDTVVEWQLAGQNVISDLGFTDIEALDSPLITMEFYPFIHKKHKKIIPGLTKALKDMKADGTYKKIVTEALNQMHMNP